MHSYSQDLRNIKTTFKGISEYKYVAKIIRKEVPLEPINILDIGIGDGHFSIRLSQKLTSYFCGHRIFGVDPDPTLVDIQYPSNFVLHNIPFELFHTSMKMDIILAIHSLYYLSSIKEFIEKISSMISIESRIFIILISTKCVLNKICDTGYNDRHVKRFLTVEQAYSSIKSYFPKLLTTIKFLHGTVDLSQWLASPLLLNSAYRIFSRNIDCYKNYKVDERALSDFIDVVRLNVNERDRTVGIIEIRK